MFKLTDISMLRARVIPDTVAVEVVKLAIYGVLSALPDVRKSSVENDRMPQLQCTFTVNNPPFHMRKVC